MFIATHTSVGAYQIVGRLGVGGMGEVFRAWDSKLGREVAIKVLPEAFVGDPGRLGRFELEIRSLAALSHPNVVQVFDAGEQDDRPYLVMELVEGETLRQRLTHGPMPWRKAAELAAAVAEGLAAAHAKGIIHRDLKPENLMLTVHGHVKILDFGLAKLQAEWPEPSVPVSADQGAGADLTGTGTVMGTTHYMSPEQVQGCELDARSDLFSLGVMLWEMVTGTQPFQGATAAHTMAAVLSSEPSGAGQLPPQLMPILDTCLEKDPGRRFQSAHDLAAALRAIAIDVSGDRAVGDPDPRFMTVFRWILGATAGVFLLLVAAGGFHVWREWPVPLSARFDHATPSVLALPTKVIGAGDASYLADAVPSTLSTLLAGSKRLDTILPPSSAQVERLQGDLSQITEAYQADHLVVTTLTKKQGSLLLNIQLVDTQSWKVEWAHQYQGSENEFHSLIREAAEAVARTLTQEDGTLPPFAQVVTNPEVERALREGTHFSNRYMAYLEDQDFRLALASYERAFGMDSKRADTAAQIAFLHAWRALHEPPADASTGEKARQRVEFWARRALTLDPHCGLAWSSLAIQEMLKAHADPTQTVAMAVKGLCFAPKALYAHAAFARAVSGPGALTFLLATGHREMELDPLDAMGPADVALGLAFLGRADESAPFIARALHVQPGYLNVSTLTRAYALIRRGEVEEAERILTQSDRPIPPMVRFWILAARGRVAEARDCVRPLLATWLGPRMRAADASTVMAFNAPLLVRIGLHEEALALMQQSVDVGSAPGLDWLLADPDLEKVRADPRFARILDAARAGAAMVVRQLDQARTQGDLPEYLLAPLEEVRGLVRQLPEDGKDKRKPRQGVAYADSPR